MQQINKHERDWLFQNYKTLEDTQLSYWYNKIGQRLNELLPLRKEIKRKNLDLNLICKDLNDEIIEINKLRDLITDNTFNEI